MSNKVIFNITIAIVEKTNIAFLAVSIAGIVIKQRITKYPKDKKFHWILGAIKSLIGDTKIKEGDIKIQFFFQDFNENLEYSIRTTTEVVKYLKARNHTFKPCSKKKLHRLLSLFHNREYESVNSPIPQVGQEISRIRCQVEIHKIRTYEDFKAFNSPEEKTIFA